GQPEQMQRWIAIREQLCDTVGRLREEEQRVEQTQARAARAAKRLRSVLSTSGSVRAVEVPTPVQGGLFDEPSEDDLIALYDEAVSVRGERQRTHQQYEALRRRREELAEELPQAETRFEKTQKVVEDWREDWRRTTEAFVSSDRVGTTEVLQMLDQISDLTAKKRERDILATRIRSIGEDEIAYSERVHRLAASVGKSMEDGRSTTSAAQAIYQRLQSERAAVRSRETIREQLESTKMRLSEVAIQQSACEQVLKQLCEEAGCDAPEGLPEIEEASRNRRELQATLRDLENQLSLLAGDQSIDELIDAATGLQPALLDIEIEQHEQELTQLRDQISTVQQEIGALQHELNLMDGSGRASELLQSIQLTVGKVSKDVEEFARKKVASLILRRAIDHYRKENQSPVLANANRFFAQLTCDEYSELKPDYDTKGKATLFGVNEKGAEVPVGSMSTGTADSLYLALRLASLEHQLSHGNAIPLVIDDCLVQLDDKRSLAALQAFSELSDKTQVILFTHHEHLRRLAEQNLGADQFHVHELAP
ncbi:MAG: ATP-binding protein, partial [Rubripirellula sp.]